MAPWATDDAAESWCVKADRFALGVCIAEILSVRDGDRLAGDGSWFDQAEVGVDGARYQELHGRVREHSQELADLFSSTWTASSFQQLTAPLGWMRALANSGTAGSDFGDFEGIGATVARTRAAMATGAWASRPKLSPGVAEWLTGIEYKSIKRAQRHWATAMKVRSAVRSGDAEALVALTTEHGLERLPGLTNAERVVSRAMLVRRFAADEAAAVEDGPDLEKLVGHWEAVVYSGGAVPAHLVNAVRRARIAQVLGPQMTQGQANQASQAPPSGTGQAPINSSLSQRLEVRQVQRDQSSDRLVAAISSGDTESIAAAAMHARSAGATFDARDALVRRALRDAAARRRVNHRGGGRVLSDTLKTASEPGVGSSARQHGAEA